MRCCAATINAQGARIRDRRIGIGTHAGAAGPLTDIANSVRTRLPHSSRNDSPTHAHSHPDERAVQPEEHAMALSQSEAGVRPPRPLRSLHGRPLHHQANRTRTTDHRRTGTETAALTTPPSGTCPGEPSTPAQDRAPDLTRGPARLEHPPARAAPRIVQDSVSAREVMVTRIEEAGVLQPTAVAGLMSAGTSVTRTTRRTGFSPGRPDRDSSAGRERSLRPIAGCWALVVGPGS